MKVLQINAVYGYSSTGTIMKQIQDLALQSGIDARVAFSAGHGESSPSGTEKGAAIEIGDWTDHKLHALLSRIEGKQAYFSKGATRKLLRYIDQFSPDVVHLHNLHSNYINLNLLLEYLAEKDIATVITMHDCWYFTGGCFHYADAGCDKWKSGCGQCPKQKSDTPALLRDRSAEILRDRAKYLNKIPRLTMVGCSEWIAEECKKSVLGNRNIITIHNGFNFDNFHPTPSDLRIKYGLEDKYVLIGPASKWLSEVNKDTYRHFIENMDKDMVLVLFGHPAPDTPAPENVRFIGYVRNPKEMAAIYSMGDVMVNCSREDTLSSINIEAQACGTPAVVYDATGNPETVAPGIGITVPTGDYTELLEAVKQMKQKNGKTEGEKSRRYVTINFDPHSNYSRYIDVYKSMI